MAHNSETIRETLLKAAREAGQSYLHVRGVDLEAAINGTALERPVTKPGELKKDN